MNNTMKERLIHLATAQELMAEASDKMTEWDKSQLNMEKSAFDSLNLSDQVLKFSKEGSMLINRLLECCQSVAKNPQVTEQKKMKVVLEEIHDVFNKINEASMSISKISHKIEAEAAAQKDLEESIRDTFAKAEEKINTVAASTELVMAENLK